MKYFTDAQIEEIRRRLATLGVKDTDLPYAKTLSGDEVIAIVQEGINKKVGIKDFFVRYLPEDFVERLVEGDSAYDLAVKEGYQGTLAEWLESLHGRDGRNGTNGTNGTKGADGTSAGVASTHTATVDSPGGNPSVQVTASGPNTAKVFHFAFHNIGGNGSGPAPSGSGRSVVSVEAWFKLTANKNLAAPELSVSNPSTAGWSLTEGEPTASLPYLRCFLQTNYDALTDEGFMYSRTNAYTVRYFHSDSSGDYSSLVEELASLRAELEESLAGYEADVNQLNLDLANLRNTIQGSILSNINNLKDRLDRINGTDVEEILVEAEGLWGVMTSWTNESGDKKAFADILARAQDAKVTLRTGYEFFNGRNGAEITLDALKNAIDARVTSAQLESILASEITIEAGALRSVISKAHSGWKKTEQDGTSTLYRYDLYWTDFFADYDEEEEGSGSDSSGYSGFAAYEAYMQKSASQGGPNPGEGDDRPEGPFELVVIVDEFSAIQQTMDSISMSVDTYKYMWFKNGEYREYEYFKTNGDGNYPSWNNRSDTYESYSYDQYVRSVLRWDQVEIGNALSNITQTSGNIRTTLANMGYVWRRATVEAGGGYEYCRYAVPANKTHDQYYAEMRAQGWMRYDYSSDLAIIDVFPDQITSLVKKSTLVWINDDATGNARVLDYDFDLATYDSLPRSITYEEYVRTNYPGYELTVVTDSFSRINQTADAINLAVSGQGTRIGALEVRSDKIWAAVSDGDDVKAGIEIIADAANQEGSKIKLTADNVEIDGFTFEDQKISSISTDGSNNPNIVIDGETGEFIANDATIRGHVDAEEGTIGPLSISGNELSASYSSNLVPNGSMKHTNSLELDSKDLEISSHYGSVSATGPGYVEGKFTVGLGTPPHAASSSGTRNGFVEIVCERNDYGGGAPAIGGMSDAGLYIAADGIPAIDAQGDVNINGDIILTGEIKLEGTVTVDAEMSGQRIAVRHFAPPITIDKTMVLSGSFIFIEGTAASNQYVTLPSIASGDVGTYYDLVSLLPNVKLYPPSGMSLYVMGFGQLTELTLDTQKKYRLISSSTSSWFVLDQ